MPTQKFKDEKSQSKLDNLANRVKGNWDGDIEYDGYCTIDITTYWAHEVELNSLDRESPYDARDASANYIKDEYEYLLEDFDAILVRDSYNHSTTANGAAYVGEFPSTSDTDWETGDQAAGSETKHITAYCANHNSSQLEEHELAHLFGGNQEHHSIYGAWQYTIMGNDGDPNCHGGTTSDYRTRTGTFNSGSGCTVDRIRDYMKEWNHTNSSFSS